MPKSRYWERLCVRKPFNWWLERWERKWFWYVRYVSTLEGSYTCFLTKHRKNVMMINARPVFLWFGHPSKDERKIPFWSIWLKADFLFWCFFSDPSIKRYYSTLCSMYSVTLKYIEHVSMYFSYLWYFLYWSTLSGSSKNS